jgi:hypothetical protein
MHLAAAPNGRLLLCVRALLVLAPHGGHRPSALTEVGYREPGPGRRSGWRNERARAALTRGPRQPEIGRPASERQPQKGRPVISMREDPDPVVGLGPHWHARTPTCAGPMQARRNPSRAATKSQASVRVQRQYPVLAACSRDVPARVQTKRRSPSRIADLRIQSALYTGGNASYRLCAQIKDERSVRWCNRLEWNRLASFVEDPSIECGQPRHACCDEAAQRLLESRKGHSTGGVRPWLGTAFSASNTETERTRVRSWGSVIRRAYGRCLVGDKSTGREGKHARASGRCAYDHDAA